MQQIRRLEFLIVAALAVSLAAAPATAFSIGASMKDSEKTAVSGQNAEFTALFWNREETGYNLTVSVDGAPEDWVVVIHPRSFMSSSSSGTESVSLSSGYVGATPVKIFIRPGQAEPGVYKMKLNAVSNTGIGDMLSFSPGVSMDFSLRVIGARTVSESVVAETEDGEKINEPDRIDVTTPPRTGQEDGGWDLALYAAIGIAILAAAAIIYRYA